MEKYIDVFSNHFSRKGNQPVKQWTWTRERKERKKNYTILSLSLSLCVCVILRSAYFPSLVSSSVHRKNRGQSIRHIFHVRWKRSPRRFVCSSYSRDTKRRPCFIRMYLELTSGTFEQWEPRAIQTIRHLYPAAASPALWNAKSIASCIRELHSNERNLYRNAFLNAIQAGDISDIWPWPGEWPALHCESSVEWGQRSKEILSYHCEEVHSRNLYIKEIKMNNNRDNIF